MNYALLGYGRMGRAIEAEAEGRGHHRCAACGRSELSRGASAIRDAIADAKVAFEFTVGALAEANIRTCLRANVPVVCGTTGWSPSDRLQREMVDSDVAVVIAPNFSVGVQLFYGIARRAAELVGASRLYQPFVFESHHRGKRDMPSGTARRLAEIVVDADPRLRGVHEGRAEEGVADDLLHVAAVRAGSDPGMHTVGFDGAHDRITLRHSARSRAGFALGAVLAAEWLPGQRGLHPFERVIEDRLAQAGRATDGAPPRGGQP